MTSMSMWRDDTVYFRTLESFGHDRVQKSYKAYILILSFLISIKLPNVVNCEFTLGVLSTVITNNSSVQVKTIVSYCVVYIVSHLKKKNTIK